MASRNQSAIDPLVKLAAIVFGGLIVSIVLVGIADGIGTNIAKFLISISVPREMAVSIGGFAKYASLFTMIVGPIVAYLR